MRWGVVYIPIPPLKSQKGSIHAPRMTKTTTQTIIKPSTTKKTTTTTKSAYKNTYKSICHFFVNCFGFIRVFNSKKVVKCFYCYCILLNQTSVIFLLNVFIVINGIKLLKKQGIDKKLAIKTGLNILQLTTKCLLHVFCVLVDGWMGVIAL